MGPVDYIKLFIKNLVKFDGRSRRSEFWWPYLAFMVLYVAVMILSAVFGALGDVGGILVLILNLAFLVVALGATIGFIAAGIRRVHDHGKTGWFILIPIYNLILYATEGDKGPNEFGPDPKGGVAGDTFA